MAALPREARRSVSETATTGRFRPGGAESEELTALDRIAPSLEAGRLVGGRYRLKKCLGSGGMGVVWSAVNEATERDVAIKFLPSDEEFTEELRVRLLREARACGRIVSRHVVEMYDVGITDDGDPFLVMALLRGESLAAVLERKKKLSVQEALRIVRGVARGLGAAHAVGIAHRDLKPENIFLHQEASGEDPIVKLLDFGVSKIFGDTLTGIGVAVGSPAYMSPEQARGDRQLDHRTDAWALGVLLFELIAGVHPFEREFIYLVVEAILRGPIPVLSETAPHVDRRVSDLVARCLQRDPQFRLGSMEEFLQEIAPLMRGDSEEDIVTSAVRARPQTAIPTPTEVDKPSHSRLAVGKTPRQARAPGPVLAPPEVARRGPRPLGPAPRPLRTLRLPAPSFAIPYTPNSCFVAPPPPRRVSKKPLLVAAAVTGLVVVVLLVLGTAWRSSKPTLVPAAELASPALGMGADAHARDATTEPMISRGLGRATAAARSKTPAPKASAAAPQRETKPSASPPPRSPLGYR